jgi:hypothetical protein
VSKVAIYFLLRANFKSTQWYDGTQVVNIPAGSFITSYARVAAACNLSVQQVRDAFGHLFRTQFATYTRTERWTLVTILNWAAYQASTVGGEHSGEHAVEQPNNRQATTDEEPRIKGVNTPTSPSDWNSVGAPLKLVPPDGNGRPRQSTLEIKPYRDVLEQVARSIHDRHPNIGNANGRRNLSVAGVERMLEAILKHKRTPTAACEAYLRQIDRNHAGVCSSENWQKENGRFVKALRNYLAPTEQRYDFEPTVPSSVPASVMPQTLAQMKAEREQRRREEGFTDAQSA